MRHILFLLLLAVCAAGAIALFRLNERQAQTAYRPAFDREAVLRQREESLHWDATRLAHDVEQALAARRQSAAAVTEALRQNAELLAAGVRRELQRLVARERDEYDEIKGEPLFSKILAANPGLPPYPELAVKFRIQLEGRFDRLVESAGGNARIEILDERGNLVYRNFAASEPPRAQSLQKTATYSARIGEETRLWKIAVALDAPAQSVAARTQEALERLKAASAQYPHLQIAFYDEDRKTLAAVSGTLDAERILPALAAAKPGAPARLSRPDGGLVLLCTQPIRELGGHVLAAGSVDVRELTPPPFRPHHDDEAAYAIGALAVVLGLMYVAFAVLGRPPRPGQRRMSPAAPAGVVRVGPPPQRTSNLRRLKERFAGSVPLEVDWTGRIESELLKSLILRVRQGER